MNRELLKCQVANTEANTRLINEQANDSVIQQGIYSAQAYTAWKDAEDRDNEFGKWIGDIVQQNTKTKNIAEETEILKIKKRIAQLEEKGLTYDQAKQKVYSDYYKTRFGAAEPYINTSARALDAIPLPKLPNKRVPKSSETVTQSRKKDGVYETHQRRMEY